jgi:hypothetical protein
LQARTPPLPRRAKAWALGHAQSTIAHTCWRAMLRIGTRRGFVAADKLATKASRCYRLPSSLLLVSSSRSLLVGRRAAAAAAAATAAASGVIVTAAAGTTGTLSAVAATRAVIACSADQKTDSRAAWATSQRARLLAVLAPAAAATALVVVAMSDYSWGESSPGLTVYERILGGVGRCTTNPYSVN